MSEGNRDIQRLETSPFINYRQYKQEAAQTSEKVFDEPAKDNIRVTRKSGRKRWKDFVSGFSTGTGAKKGDKAMIIMLAVVVVICVAMLAMRTTDQIMPASAKSLVPSEMKMNPDIGKLQFVSIIQSESLGDTYLKRNIKWQMPVEGEVIEKFGENGLTGITIGIDKDNKVKLAADAVLEDSGVNIPGLSIIVARHNDSVYSAYYFEGKMEASPGQTLKRGQVLGTAKKGTPMFFEIYIDGEAVDPLTLIKPIAPENAVDTEKKVDSIATEQPTEQPTVLPAEELIPE